MRAIRKPVLVDVLLAAVLTLATLADVAGMPWPALVLAGLTAAPLAWRQRAPVATTMVIAGALAVYSALGYGEHPNAGVGVLVAMFTVATLRPRHVAGAAFLVLMAVLAVGWAASRTEVAWASVAQSTLLVVGAWVLGEGTRRWGVHTERLAERATRAVAVERARVARELHDVVARHVAVISLQAGVAQYVIDTDVAAAREAITTVGDAGREALVEMRRLLDVLRVEDGEDFAPGPGLASPDDLVDRTRGAGPPVDVPRGSDVDTATP